MDNKFEDGSEHLELPLGRDEWFEVRITITDDNIDIAGGFVYQNIEDLKNKILQALPEGKRASYAHTANLVALCLIAKTYDHDITDQVHDKFCRSEAAWVDCMGVGKHFDHYEPATGSEWQLEQNEEGVTFYRASKERP